MSEVTESNVTVKDEVQKVSKVISLHTRKPIANPEVQETTKEEKPKEILPDKDIERLINYVKDLNAKGRIKSFSFIVWDKELERWQRGLILPANDIANEAIRLTGALELVKQDLLSAASAFSDYFVTEDEDDDE